VAVIKKPTATSAIQTYYIHADHLNTPRVIVNASNTVIWRWDNVHAFGANLPLEDPDGNGQLFEYNPRFPGQYFDKETNLHYNYFRYYEPETGRYISPDPIGLMGGVNVYGYASASPLMRFDQYGLLDITNPASWPLLPTSLVNFFEGYGSYYRDIGKIATHFYRRSGIAGICLEQQAIRNETALALALYALSDSTVARQAALNTQDWANNNKSYLRGRLTAGGITNALAGIGPYGGLSLAMLVGMGNALDNINRAGGTLSSEQALRSILGDQMSNLSNLHQTGCGCSK